MSDKNSKKHFPQFSTIFVLPFSFYHFRSTLKRDDFFAHVYFSNFTVLSGYVSLLTNEMLAVMSRNRQGSWRYSNMF